MSHHDGITRPAEKRTHTYAGIGSRETPWDVRALMTQIGEAFAQSGYTLRSGNAPGADLAFYEGAADAGDDIEIYLPWQRFNYGYLRKRTHVRLTEPDPAAFGITSHFHPAWDRLSDPVKKLMARNAHQILGPVIDTPVVVDFVICWTPDGKGGGGTGQALRIADYFEVACFDLARPSDRRRIMDGLEL